MLGLHFWLGLDRDIFCHLCQCSDMFIYRYATMSIYSRYASSCVLVLL